MDTEKTYSGLTDGCAAAGAAGCRLIEITGDNATGDDVKTLVNNAHDVIDLILRVARADHGFVLASFGNLPPRIRRPSPAGCRERCGFLILPPR